MSLRPSRAVLALAAALALAGCQSKPPIQKLPDISFAEKRPIQLDVGQLEIVPEYVSPAKKPNIEHLMPVSPENATVRWAQDRLRPVGRSGFARVVIKDARVVEVPLRTDKGFTGMFKEEQSARFDGTLDVAIQILDDRHIPVGDVVARATRTKTVPEGASLNDRDRVLYEITESLIRDIDGQMDGLVRSYLNRWVQ